MLKFIVILDITLKNIRCYSDTVLILSIFKDLEGYVF